MRKEGGSLSTPNMPNSVTSERRKSRLPTGLTLYQESVLRQDRRERAMEREQDAQHRESCGKKPYLIHVNSEGQTYGLGVTICNDALSKVVRGLDPSYIDIRQQPCHLMDTLLKRLDEEFDYNDTVNPSWLKKRIGNALSSYRHELMKMIQAKETRPLWISESVWEKLVKMSDLEKYKRKSEAMRYASSCRRSYGRTGPIGEAGIIEKLCKILGRSFAPDEINAEMQRDKGYGGRSRKLPPRESSESHPGSGGESLCEPFQEEAYSHPASADSAPKFHVTYGTGAASEDESTHNVSRTGPTVTPSSGDILGATSTENPLVLILQKQIDEILNFVAADSVDGQSLVATLRLQLSNMQQKSVSAAPPPRVNVSPMNEAEPQRLHSSSGSEETAEDVNVNVSEIEQVSFSAVLQASKLSQL